jgi:GntR family transcriptional regulator, galactonate operon transcriptional repressor
VSKNATTLSKDAGRSTATEIRPPAFPEAGGTRAHFVDLIGRDIVSGLYPPQSRLPDEDSMRRRYSVSRTALREAYSKLTAKGLIAARPRVGTSVRPQSAWNMLDPEVLGWHLQTKPAGAIANELYVLRRMVEPQASALAATEHDAEALARIEEAYADMKARAGSEGDLIEADLRFHIAILSATRNHFIGAFSALIHAAMVSTFSISWRGAGGIREERLKQHGDVLDAIARRDPDLARTRMEKLLDDSLEDVREAIGRDTLRTPPRGAADLSAKPAVDR